jgi:hypothetical protein
MILPGVITVVAPILVRYSPLAIINAKSTPVKVALSLAGETVLESLPIGMSWSPTDIFCTAIAGA